MHASRIQKMSSWIRINTCKTKETIKSRLKKQLKYYTNSEVQEDVRVDYFEKYVDRKYYNNDVFLNWAKSIFKTDNFLSLAKYYRNPNPASSLINNKIKEPLTRVYFSEDSHFKYWINGEYVDCPMELDDGFEKVSWLVSS